MNEQSRIDRASFGQAGRLKIHVALFAVWPVFSAAYDPAHKNLAPLVSLVDSREIDLIEPASNAGIG